MMDDDIDDGSDKPEGFITEDGELEVKNGEYHETELGQFTRWMNHASDLYGQYLEAMEKARMSHERIERLELELAVQQAWGAVAKEGLQLVRSDVDAMRYEVLSQDSQYDLVGWVNQYTGPYDKEKKEYADRKAVGFSLHGKPNGLELPVFQGFRRGLAHIIEHWDELAESYPAGGALPAPKIAIAFF